jgi:hypothetical protein
MGIMENPNEAREDERFGAETALLTIEKQGNIL